MKSTNTIRNNMDFKNEFKNQRTSLHYHEKDYEETLSADSISTSSTSSLSQQSFSQQASKLATVKRCYSRSDNKSKVDQHSSSGSNRSSIVQSPTDNNVKNNNAIDDRNGIHENSENCLSHIVKSNGKKWASKHVNHLQSDGLIYIEYTDHENGNNSHNSQQKCDLVNSKESCLTEDYFLCEKLKNKMLAKLCDAVLSDAVVLVDDNMSEKGMPMELLSPHEVPMGRRYAEIAPSKNSANIKW